MEFKNKINTDNNTFYHQNQWFWSANLNKIATEPKYMYKGENLQVIPHNQAKRNLYANYVPSLYDRKTSTGSR